MKTSLLLNGTPSAGPVFVALNEFDGDDIAEIPAALRSFRGHRNNDSRIARTGPVEQDQDRLGGDEENHNWTGDNSGAKFGAPDLKGNPAAPYINGPLLNTSAHSEQYYNPPGNHPSQPNYLWLEAGTNFGVLADTQPGQPQLTTHAHLVHLLENYGYTWRSYAEPDFGAPVFDTCPLDFTYFDVEHLAQVYFKDVNGGLNRKSAECRAHVAPYYQLSTDLANQTAAQYNVIVPNLCHDGHEGVKTLRRGRAEGQHRTLRPLAFAQHSDDPGFRSIQSRRGDLHHLGRGRRQRRL